MELTVLYYDPTWHLLWGETNGQYGYLSCAGPLPIQSRQRILIEGEVVPRAGLSAERVRITVLDDFVAITPLAPGRRVTEYERFNSRVVVVEGFVNQREYGVLDHTVLHLIVEGTRVRFSVFLGGAPHVFRWSRWAHGRQGACTRRLSDFDGSLLDRR